MSDCVLSIRRMDECGPNTYCRSSKKNSIENVFESHGLCVCCSSFWIVQASEGRGGRKAIQISTSSIDCRNWWPSGTGKVAFFRTIINSIRHEMVVNIVWEFYFSPKIPKILQLKEFRLVQNILRLYTFQWKFHNIFLHRRYEQRMNKSAHTWFTFGCQNAFLLLLWNICHRRSALRLSHGILLPHRFRLTDKWNRTCIECTLLFFGPFASQRFHCRMPEVIESIV